MLKIFEIAMRQMDYSSECALIDRKATIQFPDSFIRSTSCLLKAHQASTLLAQLFQDQFKVDRNCRNNPIYIPVVDPLQACLLAVSLSQLELPPSTELGITLSHTHFCSILNWHVNHFKPAE